MHLPDNIKLIRRLRGETQPQFVGHFTDVSVPMQKSYEGGKAQPDEVYMMELSNLTGIPTYAIINSTLSIEDVRRAMESTSSVEKVESDHLSRRLELGNINVTVADYIELQSKMINLQEKLTQTLLEAQDANSKKMDFYADEVIKNMRADHDTMMGALDLLLGVQPGTLEKESDNRMTGVPSTEKETRSQKSVSGTKGKG